MQQLNSQSDLEDEDADVETESVQKEDFFNLRQLSEVMSTESKNDGKIASKHQNQKCSQFIFDIDEVF